VEIVELCLTHENVVCNFGHIGLSKGQVRNNCPRQFLEDFHVRLDIFHTGLLANNNETFLLGRACAFWR